MKGICFFLSSTKPLEKRKKEKGETTMTNTQEHATWGELLHSAVHTPGKLLAAYTAFHNYSFGNALLALEQCISRKIEPGPLNSYKGWLQLKRQVRKGEKGLCLCMPVTYKKRVTGRAASETSEESEESEESQDEVRQRFVFRNYWFVLAQTEGETPYEQPIPGFDLEAALQTLGITRTPFDEINGNVQGFAHQREIAVSPIAELPLKTTFHEAAHVILGHTSSQKLVDLEHMDRNIREVEAESVALICCESLGLPGAEAARGYIQHWLQGEKEIPNQSAARIFSAVQTILKAGNSKEEGK
jgi:antirestriction protein ArdC